MAPGRLSAEARRAEGPLGVWLVGARGAVAAMTVVGAAALARGLVAPTGLVTAHPPFADLDLAPVDQMVFGGHEVRQGDLISAAGDLTRAPAVLDAALAAAVADDLVAADARIRPAPAPVGPAAPLRDVITAIQDDLADFAVSTGARRTVMVNVASTEPAPPAHPAHDRLSRLDAALDATPPPPAVLPPSLLSAYAAIDMGVPYVNFTPSFGASAAALEELALARGVAHAGRDAKTGETLLKTVLAPMFAMRRLEVTGWAGVNLLGNGDGRTLADPAARRSKTASKGRAVPDILGYEPDAVVRIDYLPSCGDTKVAWDLIHFRGFLDAPMSLQLTWQASDSALAAPLVLDLARLVDLAGRRGERGALGHLGFFFKSPLGTDEHDLWRQHEHLRAHLGRG